jgi:SAM-dependent methyltransferase
LALPKRRIEVTTHEGTYAFDNALRVQLQRLRALQLVLDEGTIDVLEARGVEAGWHCLEVGAGGGSIAGWLCERVGPGGVVVATDINTVFLERQAYSNLEVRVHDVRRDELPIGQFDLIHCRLLLAWLEKPQDAMKRLVAALKPGGWLVVEEMDFESLCWGPGLDEHERDLFARLVDVHNAVLIERHAFDPFYGRRVAYDMANASLVDVGAAGRVSVWQADQPGGLVWQLTLAQLREGMIETGRMTSEEIDAAITLCNGPRLSLLSPVTMAAWGRHR